MHPFNCVDTGNILSTQVLSRDGKSVMVEAGYLSPLRWFMSRGHSLERRDEEDEYEPPSKRRKITDIKETTDDAQRKTTDTRKSDAKHSVPDESDILLGRTTLNFPLSSNPETKSTKTVQIPVILTQAEQVDGVLTLRLAHTSKHGEVLQIDISEVTESTYQVLRLSTFLIAPSSSRPASKHYCYITNIINESIETIMINTTITWRDGASAFPAGAPTGRTRVYEDYDIYSYLFPDQGRLSVDHSKPWTPRDFYESVHTPEKSVHVDVPDILDTQLFPFQKRAVAWMMAREGTSEEPLTMFQQSQDADNNVLYHSSLQGIISHQPPLHHSDVRGGILAEEMGLGKTVEVMSLVAAHPRVEEMSSSVHDTASGTNVQPSRATLIITPTTILRQWMSELSQHAPQLKVFHYTGVTHDKTNKNEQELLDKMANDYDVVLTTYTTLTQEVHFATDPPARNMRHTRKYERRRSPLIQLQWWRICLDEAQMVESGVTAAARVACRLPRINSWAVTGTPVKKNVEDLYGLLVFLRLEPFASNAKLWGHLITNHRHIFRKIFQTIALRHTKAQIREDIQLPPQKRVVMTLPFTAVESQHYLTLFQEMCEEVGVGQDGSPASESWDPDDPHVVESMRIWLIRLRQTCLHPQVGTRNRRRLGRGQGPLRTVDEVLNVMIEQNETSIRTDERASINALIQRAHILGNARDDQQRAKKALELYASAQTKCELIVTEARARLAAAVAAGQTADTTDDEDSSSETAPLLGRIRSSLRGALQLLHVCIYFAATATYQIKVNEETTKPDSDEFKALEEREVELYEQAKLVRREILKDAADKSERIMRKIKSLQSSNSLVDLPTFEDLEDVRGIESRRIVANSYPLFDTIRGMRPYIVEWRAKIIEILSKPLVDEDESGNEITGDEYEESTKQQDELYVYFDALKALQADLNRCITGESAPLIDHEAKGLVRTAKRWLDPEIPDELKELPHAPELLLKLFGIRQTFRSRLEEVGSIRGLIAEARQLHEPGSLGGRASVEGELARKLMKSLQTILSGYTKAISGLQKELELCGVTQNQRLQFYRQLQEVSDAVAPYKEELDESLDSQALEQARITEKSHLTSLAQLKTKHRFLVHLKEESTQQDSARICVICQCSFENGVLTVCGHQYCKECIQHWWSEHRTCPVCKRKLALVDFHNITYKPKEVKIQEENQPASDSPEESSATSPSQSMSIYSEADGQLRDQIKRYDLSSSYGTKIDTLSRHLLWIREHDPGAKSIVFSQYREFLDVLSSAFTEFKIGHQRLGRAGAVESFRQDPSVDCLLLDAKTDSSGLTLVNATHVFVCEPLVQTAVELQAIARVHRIGQVRPTTVWMYLVNDTVEESIYEISVARRMALVQSRQISKAFQKSRSSTPGPFGEQAIDAANSEELQNAPLSKLLASGKGGGELVEKSDLWQCLFGKAQKANPEVDVGFTNEIDRNLRAQAAENRRNAVSSAS